MFLTREQTAGRGQGGNQWYASPGDNLTLSILLRPAHLSVERLFALSECVSLAIVRALRHFLPPHLACLLRVKWPNDVYVGDRKIAGILIQNGLRRDQLLYAVVGIGLNVNERIFPAVLCERATSLYQLLHETTPLEDVSEQLFGELAHSYALTQPGNLSELHAAYREQLYRLGTPVNYERTADGSLFQASIRDVTPSGQLVLVHPDGRQEQFGMREVRFLPEGTAPAPPALTPR